MKVYKIKTTFDCLIKTETAQVILQPNETLETNHPEMLNVYPLHGRLPSFCCDLNNLEKSLFYDYVDCTEETILCFSQKIRYKNYKVLSVQTSYGKCTFEISKYDFVVYTNKWKKIVPMQGEFIDFQVLASDTIVVIKFKGNSKDSLFAFNINTENVKKFVGENIDLNETGFSVKTAQSTISYKFTKQGLKCANETTTNSSCDQTLPYTFLTALQQGATSSALSMCTDSLKQKLNPSSLKKFFGNISNIFTLSPYRYAITNEKGVAIYWFVVENQKIIDIEN